jgi:hypothetical protein
VSFEVEFRLPTQAYAYINVSIKAENAGELESQLQDLQNVMMDRVSQTYNKCVEILNGKPVSSEPVKAKPVVDTPEPTANELIKSELGGTVISVTDTPKPWERAKPATASSIADF